MEIIIATESFHFKKNEHGKSASDPQSLHGWKLFELHQRRAQVNWKASIKCFALRHPSQSLKKKIKKLKYFQQPQLGKRKNSLTNITPNKNPRDGTATRHLRMSRAGLAACQLLSCRMRTTAFSFSGEALGRTQEKAEQGSRAGVEKAKQIS